MLFIYDIRAQPEYLLLACRLVMQLNQESVHGGSGDLVCVQNTALKTTTVPMRRNAAITAVGMSASPLIQVKN